MKTRFIASALLLSATLFPTAWAADVDLSKPVPKIEARKPISAAALGVERSVQFALWKSAVEVNDVVGRLEDGLFCTESSKLLYGKKLDDWLLGQVSKVFREEATRLGFAEREENKSVFDEKPASGADFRVGATLLQLDYRSCGNNDIKGSVFTKVKWEVFSVRRQKVIYTASIDASYSSDKELAGKDFSRGFVLSMVDNLFGDTRFAEAIRTDGVGIEPAGKALAPLTLNPGQQVSGGVGKAATSLLGAVVTIESGVGSGSAFYISQDGYLLTNQHVVGDAKFVRVKLAGGRSVVGEVLRADSARDVALIRTDATTSAVLAIRPTEARVGEEVYALGSPFGDMLSGTLTRGVMSSRRIFEGVAYLQSDVAINPGNSGGPLLDADGTVLGIAELGSRAQGINLFIPIGEALDKLSLVLGPRPLTPTASK